MKYFSYGSNMSIKRISARVPSAVFDTVAILNGHNLKFRKISRRDTSAKCDIAESSNETDIVWGVVFEIDHSGKAALDRVEGLGYGYEQKQVELVGTDGATFSAFTYYATDIDENLKPYTWYVEHVLRGARENDLPAGYIAFIEEVGSIQDPDRDRHEQELSIYR
ncbi:gamma-glutamylcyclotransferase family protein [Marinobacter sp. M216]|uniref:Gamma-glutamylcyclotransferase family protein n=1 Tax=Marinobacter albus TaxID=3030833 RepID=A0ABT7HBS5_9GAMM|nr:gamma-glutamylcyclotransferase family protein [Marinobacter sp. M216]MDK9557843.1 gamma-glutamylcyclotransferase family protein [Marinobacter sp. M216]